MDLISDMESKGVKRKSLTLLQKVEVLKKYDERLPSVSQKEFASSVNIAPSSLRTLLQNREEIEKKCPCWRFQKEKSEICKT